jgi:hypothetical protein
MKGNIPPQELAKTATYLKRVALCAAVGIAADDDDDGEMANRTNAIAAADDEQRIERLGAQKIRDSKTKEERDEILEKAKTRVDEGTLSPSALKRLQALAEAKEDGTKTTKKVPAPSAN